MNQTDCEALEERMEEVLHEIETSRRAVEWLEDHTQEENMMGNLTLIRRNLQALEEKLCGLLGYIPEGHPVPVTLQEDVPFD